MLGDRVCFYPSGESTKLIPREQSDQRMAWFCFSDSKAAQRLLNIPTPSPKGGCGSAAMAKVVVTDYVVDLRETAAFDVARLVRVVSSQPPGKVACAP